MGYLAVQAEIHHLKNHLDYHLKVVGWLRTVCSIHTPLLQHLKNSVWRMAKSTTKDYWLRCCSSTTPIIQKHLFGRRKWVKETIDKGLPFL